MGDIIKTIGNTIKEVVKTVTGGNKNSSSSSSSSTSKSSSSSSSGSSSKSSSSSGSSSGSSSSSSSGTVVLVDPLVGVIFDVSSSEAAYWLNSGCVRLDDGGEFVFGNIINTSKYADKINIAAGSNVTITNQKDRRIGTITTGDNSNTTINNRGIIDTINIGKDSSLILNNYEGGQVGKITGGDISNKDSQLGINVTNYGHIDHIQTGVNSTNEVFNYDGGYVDWLETGYGNSSTTDGGTKYYSGQGSVKVISDLDKLKSNLYQLGYHNVYKDYTSARNQFLKDYLDNGHSLDSNFKLMGSGEHYSTLLSWTNKALSDKYTNIAGGEILFLTSDTNLKPEVQQMISYYDDMYFYAHVAYDSNIIDEYEFKALKSFCKEKVEKLRKDNSFKKADNLTYQIICSIGSAIPYAGIIFDVLGDTQPVYAADLSSEATKKISANMSVINNTVKSSRRFDYRYTVYELYDDDGVRYVGRTRQSIEARQKQHWKADANKNGLKIRVARFEGEVLEDLTHSQARGLEHLVFESHGGFNNKNLLNKIKPLDINNPKVTKKATNYIDDAWNFIKKLK